MSLLDTLTKTLVATYSEKLSYQEKEELLVALEVLANDQKYNKFQNFFPDEGEYRRELYQKHIAFFNAGATYQERCFIAANRIGKCLSYQTLIELADGTKEQAGVLYDRRIPFDVLSWDGEKVIVARVSDFIKKQPEMIYRVWLENGEWFECAANHRVLCQDGSWSFVGKLLKYVPTLPLTIEGSDQQVRFLGVIRYLETLQDSQCDCLAGRRFCDEQLLYGLEIFQGKLPQQDDVQRQDASLTCSDGLDSINANKDQLAFVLPSTQGGARLSLGQFSQREDLADEFFAQRCAQCNQERLQSLCDLTPIGEVLSKVPNQYQLVSLKSPYYALGNRIIAYSPVGCNDIYDFTVEPHHNYISHGIVHHNSESGAFEVTCHATGKYPHWWTGKRFSRPTLIWVGGDTATTCRDIIQKKLIGDDLLDMGSGMLPKEDIIKDRCKTRRNVPEALEIIKVRHVSGGESTIVIKTYEQGRATWQGTEVDFIWVDEEPPEDVYGEALIRLMTTKGSIITTYTPLQGVTPLVLSMLENSQDTESKYPKYVEICTWDDVPHLDQEFKDKTLANTPPALREARSKGVPTVGSGLIYPVDPKDIMVDDFKIPAHFQKLYGMDVGWNNTAALWGAWDRDNDIIYCFSEHKQGMAEPVIHAKAIKARGEWIKGEIDPAARGRSQDDGAQLFMLYKKEGLKLCIADNARESGIFTVWERLTTGRLKIFKSCTMTLRELSLYHRDEKGQIVKTNDHLLDCLRYLLMAPSNHWAYPQKPEDKNKVVQLANYMTAHN